jgi:octaprenyl-diphosphate synthase
MVSAACSVGAGETETEIFRTYARHIGQAFQMMDDILDFSPELSIGKPTGQDIMEKKITLPLLCLFRKAPASVERSLRRRMKKPDAALVEEIFSLVRQYDALSEAHDVLEEEIRQAVDVLAPIPASEAKNYLIKLAGLMAVRTA